MQKTDPESLAKYEREILKQEKKIEKLEEKIESEEGRILRFQKQLIAKIGFGKIIRGRLGKHEASVLRKGLIRNFAKKKFLYSATIIASVVLVWRGIWLLADVTPWISNPFVSLALGFAVLWFVNRYTRLID